MDQPLRAGGSDRRNLTGSARWDRLPNGFWQRAFWANKLCGSGILRKRFFESRASAFLPMPCFFMAPFLGTSVLQHGILPMPFLFLWFSDRRLPFCFFDTLFHTSQLCRSRFVPWRFQGPPDMGRFQRSRWTSDGHFSGRICTAGQRVKRPVWTRRTGGESTPAVADEDDGG